jgi:hypothetical protein
MLGSAEEAGAEADRWARGRGKKRKTMIHLQNFKTRIFLAPKIAKNLQMHNKATKNSMQQQALKNLS